MPDFPGRRYAAPSDSALPDLAELDFVESIDTTTGAVEETRYDTADRHLQRAGMDLCRRKDANGAAWRLSVSDAAEVMEFDSRATSPPREVSALLTGIRAGQRLVVVERILSEWDTHVLCDSSGEPVATIHDSQLTRSHPSSGFEPEVWREVEITSSGATSKSTRKTLRRLLKASGAEEIDHSRLDGRNRSRPTTSQPKGLGGLVDSYVKEQLSAIASGDFELRSNGDAVHDTRVAITRLRSTLHVFADLFDQDKAVAFSGELSWFAALLGKVRDTDVAGRHAEALMDADDSLDVTSARNHLEASAAAAKAAGHDALEAAMSGRRYAALVSTMEEWRVDPPFVEQASQPRKAFKTYVSKTDKKLRKRLRSATKKRSDADDLHRARKVAKRLRYVAELADTADAKYARSMRKRGTRWQRRLGEIQDLRITGALLSEAGKSAPTQVDAFVLGVLWARLQHETDQQYAAIVRKVD